MKPLIFNLDIQEDSYESCDLMQGYDYNMQFNITDNYTALDLTGVLVQIHLAKADHKFIIQTEKITVVNNVINVAIDKDLTRISGKGKLQVVLSKDNRTFGSWVVKCNIKASAINDNDGQSENKVTITETLTNKITEAVKVKEDTEKLIKEGGAATTGDIIRIDKTLEEIIQSEIPISFIKGTSFFCFTDQATKDYLINQPSRIENYKKCGITDVLLTLSATFDGFIITPSISYSILTQASNLLRSNGIKVGVKVQDGGINNINSSNYSTWFSEKLRVLKLICNAIENPTTVNVANENTIVTSNILYRNNWIALINDLRSSFPNTLLSVHTYFSEFYNGTITIADLVDILGVNYYPYTTDNKVPTSKEVKKAIYKPINGKPFFDTMQEYCKKYNKKFVISEWGTASFEYQCKNPSTDFIPNNQKVINPQVQSIFMSEACRLFPYVEHCQGMYLWSSNCYRNLNNDIERSWAWDESIFTIDSISKVWGGK